jgi:hypothetical protein
MADVSTALVLLGYGVPRRAYSRIAWHRVAPHGTAWPCRHFLGGGCRFSAASCKHSHGYAVPVEQVEPWREPDSALIEIGGWFAQLLLYITNIASILRAASVRRRLTLLSLLTLLIILIILTLLAF